MDLADSSATQRTLTDFPNNNTEHGAPSDKHSGVQPTSDEMVTLRRAGGRIPNGAWLVALIGFAERFTYYGVTAPFQNYIQNNRDDPLRPGALGLGQSSATRLSYFLTFFVYATSFGGAIVADGWFGRYKSLRLFASIYACGVFILLVTSLPVSLKHGAGLGGLIAAIIVFGIGAGGMKSNLAPFIADQCANTPTMHVVRTSSGERVIVDQALTLQRIYSIYYWCGNVGSLSGVATTLLERHVDFWAAFLLPACSIWVALALLILGRAQFVERPAKGTILPQAMRALWCGVRGGFKMDAALPASHQGTVPWDDTFVHELKRGLLACRVFLAWPILLLCQSQMPTNLVSQAATMETHGLPNDIIGFLNPVSVIIFLPLAEHVLYPALRRAKVKFSPINRMALGFLLESFAQAYAAGIQHLVYSTAPCFNAPLKCAPDPGPNHVNIWMQTPIYVLEGLGEVFSSPSAYEYAYDAAPASMKSVLQAVFVGMGALAVLLGFAMSPLYRDPLLVVSYSVLAGLMALTTVVYFVAFRARSGDAKADEFGGDDTTERKLPDKRSHEVVGIGSPTRTLISGSKGSE
ncbi:POT family-domain-containing protein [Mycena sanguinolenta]|uniref:POT family-domain-containing protein n=1 Tax=Mycena sanguinolenta TaxID=230812 RepID=A0A8H6X6V6_9AGAR|nr:POT family-domain-containing protein [Mycena sanguinolenta]